MFNKSTSKNESQPRNANGKFKFKSQKGTPIRNIVLAVTLTYSVILTIAFYGIFTNKMVISISGLSVEPSFAATSFDPFAEKG